jgi:hypothetical protein
MIFMEIALLSEKSLKIKGKHASVVVDPQEKQEANASLALLESTENIKSENFDVGISGPGEFETGGIKISGIRGGAGMAYNIIVDSVSVCLGKISALEKLQSKLKESNIVIVYCDDETDSAFLTSLAVNVLVLYGNKADEVGKSLAGENIKRLPKYTNTIDKLPAEIEMIILK